MLAVPNSCLEIFKPLGLASLVMLHDGGVYWPRRNYLELYWRWPLICLMLCTPSGRKQQQSFKGRTKCKYRDLANYFPFPSLRLGWVRMQVKTRAWTDLDSSSICHGKDQWRCEMRLSDLSVCNRADVLVNEGAEMHRCLLPVPLPLFL